MVKLKRPGNLGLSARKLIESVASEDRICSRPGHRGMFVTRRAQ